MCLELQRVALWGRMFGDLRQQSRRAEARSSVHRKALAGGVFVGLLLRAGSATSLEQQFRTSAFYTSRVPVPAPLTRTSTRRSPRRVNRTIVTFAPHLTVQGRGT